MFARARNFLCTILAPPTIQKPIARAEPFALVMEGNRFACNVPDAQSLKVVHDPEGQEFHIEFPNCRAFLLYEKEGNLLKIMHTEVPEELGGRGIGKVLAKAALRHIEQHKYRAETYCDYFRYYVETYEPKYLKYIEN